MKPLNLKERNAALWRFTGMYILIVFLTGTMIYLTAATIPGAGSAAKGEVLEEQQEFTADLDSLSSLFTAMDKATEEVVWKELTSKIGSKLTAMDAKYLDPKNPHPIYQKMIENHRQWAKDKEKIWNSLAENNKQKEQIEKLNEEIKKLKETAAGGGAPAPNPDLDACKQSLQRASIFAGNILNLLNPMGKSVEGIKGWRDKNHKKSLEKGLNEIRKQADKIQSL